MKNILIVGASGMIGNLILNQCLRRNDVHKVTSIVRRKSGKEHKKLIEVLHNDYENFKPIQDTFTNQDICFYCVGVYTGQVSRDEFRKITVEYTRSFAGMLRAKSPHAVFCFLSGQGADRTEKSRMMFAKDKGIAENYLLSLGLKTLFIFRPGYIYPVTPRVEPNLTYKIFRTLYPLLKTVYSSGVITSEQLAAAMVKAGFEGGTQHTFENKAIRKMLVG